MKTLVLYYSFEGNTDYVATLIQKELKADILRVKPVKDLKNTGFSKYIWGGKQVYMNEKPKLLPLDKDVNSYDRILLGSPVWAWTLAPAIKTLCEDVLKDKEIYCFYTHEGGDKGIIEKAHELVDEHNHLVSVQGFVNVLKRKEEIPQEVTSWLKNLD